ncbi:hypothetical protein ABNR98_004421 [Salmonella enterica]
MQDSRWYLVCHKAGRDNLFKAQAGLERLSVNSFSPLIRTIKPRADGGKRMSVEPLFPGYFFIEFDVEKIAVSKIKTIPGFSSFVQFGNELKPLHDSLINELMSLPMCLIENKHKERVIPNPHTLSGKNKEIIEQIAKNKDKLSRTTMLLAFIDSINT